MVVKMPLDSVKKPVNLILNASYDFSKTYSMNKCFLIYVERKE